MGTYKLITMKKLFIICLVALIAVSITKSSKYEITAKDGNFMYVNRKGNTLKFYNTSEFKVGDSVRLYLDYNINYKPLIVKQ